MKLKPLAEQTLVITGASSGIGLVTARIAAQRGAAVVLAARNSEALQTLADEIRAAGGRAAVVTADVGSEEDVQRIAQTAISTFGGFDTWVNNAGVSIFGRIEDVPVADMHRMFATVYWGVVYGSLAATRHFKARGQADPSFNGAIVNVGSFFGDRATPVQSTYASAKHAVHGFTDALRMELERDNAPVSVTLVHPGRIDTPYNEHAGSHMAHQPAHRGMVYAPEAVADAILFAAAHPRRDFFVGFQAWFAATMGQAAPRLTDKLMEHYMYWSQTANRPPQQAPEGALYEAGENPRANGSNAAWHHPGKRSLFVQAYKYPLLTTLAIVGVGAGIAALRKSR